MKGGGEKTVDKEKAGRIYARLERALTEETCTYMEAGWAMDKLRNEYFSVKASNFLNNRTIQEIADANTWENIKEKA